jgi:hypothetical protein
MPPKKAVGPFAEDKRTSNELRERTDFQALKHTDPEMGSVYFNKALREAQFHPEFSRLTP